MSFYRHKGVESLHFENSTVCPCWFCWIWHWAWRSRGLPTALSPWLLHVLSVNKAFFTAELQASSKWKPQAGMLSGPVQCLVCVAPPSGCCVATFCQSESEMCSFRFYNFLDSHLKKEYILLSFIWSKDRTALDNHFNWY